MSYFTPEVRNGKPSRLTTGLLVASIAFLTSCTPAGRQFINNMGYTAAGTFVQESITREVWGNGQEVANIQGGVQREQSRPRRRLVISKDYWTYWEGNNGMNAKSEGNNLMYETFDGQWFPIPMDTKVFLYQD